MSDERIRIAIAEMELTPELVRLGWRRCAVGQRDTQHCGLVEEARAQERETRTTPMNDPQTRPTFADRYVYAAKCVKVIDGDTLDLDIDLGFHVIIRQRVRLRGIDTPELRGPDKARAEKARDEVACYAMDVDLIIRTERDKTDKYGRMLADVWVDELVTSLSDHLVGRGLARRYDGGKR